jgi:hypothetical protein
MSPNREAAQLDRDGAVAAGPREQWPFASDSRERCFRWQAALAAAWRREHRKARANGLDPGGMAGRRAAVVRELQHVCTHVDSARQQIALGARGKITGEQNAPPVDAHAQHQRARVVRGDIDRQSRRPQRLQLEIA